MDLQSLIKEKRTDFVDLCRSHKMAKLFPFGSSIPEHFIPDCSDIDILVKIDIPDPADRGDALPLLWDKLEALFGREVDILKIPISGRISSEQRNLFMTEKEKKHPVH